MNAHSHSALAILTAIVVLLGSGTTSTRGRGLPQTLTKSDLSDAVRLGASGAPMPYELRRTERDGSESVVAKVYTPFIRVALWAATQRSTSDIQIDDIPQKLLSPILLVATPIQPTCCPEIEEGKPAWVGARIFPASQDMPPFLCMTSVGEPASWVTSDTEWMRSFDPGNADRVSALVAFPMGSIGAATDIVVEQHWRAKSSEKVYHSVHYGRVRPQDLDDWR